ncbi:response regulator [Candidatus Avelusimicrobium alvi]|uniref:response regulator n=1 Tax=Candidatus Avelusimicrobium alvi TaxID=3416221 RepID=UPI003D135BCD
MNHFYAKWIVCSLCLTLGASAYAQGTKQVITAGSRALGSSAAREASALKTMDGWYESGAAIKRAVSAAAMRAAPKPVVHPADRRDHAFRNSSFFGPITPTPVKDLRVRLIHPSQAQVNEAFAEYHQLMSDLKSLRKEVNTKLLYKTIPNDKWTALYPQERRPLIVEISRMKGRTEKLLNVVFANDPALLQADAWLDEAMKQVNPFYVAGLKRRKRLDQRAFSRDEFFLKSPREIPEGMPTPYRTEVPANMRVVVLNDQTDILDMYKLWERENRLGPGWTVATYKDTREMIHAIQSGEVYDLVITDLTVPGGGGYYLVDQLREMRLNMPIIGCSMYTIDKLNAEKMFEQGFDGYIYGDDLFEEPAGSVSWMGYIKKYYWYKNFNGWSR